MILQYITSSGKWRTFFKNNLSFPASLIDESDTIWCQKPVGIKNAKMILETDTQPWRLADNVCSPGGTTIEGVISLQKDEFNKTIKRAVNKSFEKDKLL